MESGEAITAKTDGLRRGQALGRRRHALSLVRRGVLVAGVVLISSVALAALAHWIPVAGAGETVGVVRAQGSLLSPGGAYTLEPSVKGPATYAVDVSADWNAGAPRGTVTFDFPAAGVAFSSGTIARVSKRDGVVIVQGTGTLNGRGEYPFALQLGGRKGDPGVHLTVWQLYGSSNLSWVVYDNG